MNIKSIKTKEYVKTSFNCPIELRDRLETIINKYEGIYSVEDIMNYLLDKSLSDCGY